MHRQLEFFRTLPPDWNGIGPHDHAPIPSEQSLAIAQQILDALTAVGIQPADEDINPDAMGGVAIYLYGKDPNKAAHFSIWNSDTMAHLVLSGKDVQVLEVTDVTRSIQQALAYLGGQDPAPNA